MKTILIAVMILCSEICFGQKDTLWVNKLGYLTAGTTSVGDSTKGIFLRNSIYNYNNTEYTLDTIPCIMLVVDTLSCHNCNGFDITQGLRQEGFAYYIKGYVIRNRYSFYAVNDLSVGIKYLDADKKELSKNIIVWMSK
jgi:hypothetical protein